MRERGSDTWDRAQMHMVGRGEYFGTVQVVCGTRERLSDYPIISSEESHRVASGNISGTLHRLHASVLNRKSPCDLVYNKPHSLKHLRSFGCLAYAIICNSHDKFGSRSKKYKYFFNIDTFDDLFDIPNDEERRMPSPKRNGTPPPHYGSPSTPLNENDGGHSQGAYASSSKGERFADLEDNIISFEGNDLHNHPQEVSSQNGDDV
uniref:Ribonuclease H-like domain-containing protein n=1 Tax=Tanacetum cinerariifolium TaxID=118510 RepID=A0A6L2NEW0_TANCI|nr:ribonuclease H-like domain-containing protein [Tanacetum cinerariifolium]